MKPNRIMYELRERDYSQMRIAQEMNVSHVAVHHVIYGKTMSRRIRERIAEILGKRVECIWKTA
jgi:hypothetical protein|nr:MAG TPA: SOS-response transcriptional repressor [Bacteriophage sp.]